MHACGGGRRQRGGGRQWDPWVHARAGHGCAAPSPPCARRAASGSRPQSRAHLGRALSVLERSRAQHIHRREGPAPPAAADTGQAAWAAAHGPGSGAGADAGRAQQRGGCRRRAGTAAGRAGRGAAAGPPPMAAAWAMHALVQEGLAREGVGGAALHVGLNCHPLVDLREGRGGDGGQEQRGLCLALVQADPQRSRHELCCANESRPCATTLTWPAEVSTGSTKGARVSGQTCGGTAAGGGGGRRGGGGASPEGSQGARCMLLACKWQQRQPPVRPGRRTGFRQTWAAAYWTEGCGGAGTW